MNICRLRHLQLLQKQAWIRIGISLVLLVSLFFNLKSVQAETSGVNYYVATSGADNANCGSSSAPCRSIQYAVNKASSGDTILVAAGSYGYNGSADNCNFLDTRAVVCVLDKNLTIRGGYTTTNWSAQNPAGNQTVIDGGNTYRGVAVISYNKGVQYTMNGFTVQNGLSHGAATSDSFHNTGRGGGLWSQKALIALKDMVFKNNRAIGADGYSGGVYGGAVMIEQTQGSSSLDNVVFDGNSATGGSGNPRGGVALGGSLLLSSAAMTGNQLTFTNNTAQGGASSSGSGKDGSGLTADALGGAVGFEIGSNGSLTNVVATNNKALGGNASSQANAAAGAGMGGFLHSEEATVSVKNAKIQNNQALGGIADVGGIAFGGGIMTDRSNVTIDQAWVINNLSKSGTGYHSTSTVNGGGAYFAFFGSSGSYSTTVQNTIFADNSLVQGNVSQNGGGGGMVVQGVKATVSYTTFARNQMSNGPVSGQAILVLASQGTTGTSGSLTLQNSIISDHTNGGSTAVISVMRNSSANLNTVIVANNSKLTNEDNMPVPVGSFSKTNIISASSISYVSPGSPNFDYHLKLGSPAINKASGSTPSYDFEGDPRPYNGVSDLGADEFAVSVLKATPAPVVFLTDGATGSLLVRITDSNGNLVSWSASGQATWLTLGTGAGAGQVGGSSGDMLQLNFRPGSLGNSTYETTVTLTSTQADSATFTVRLVKVAKLSKIFVPIATR